MIVEKRTYTLKPGKVAQYMKIYEEHGLAAQTRILERMVGWFYPEVGQLNQIVHMWAYDDMADRAKRREALGKDEEWRNYLKHMREADIIVHQETQILIPAPWSPKA